MNDVDDFKKYNLLHALGQYFINTYNTETSKFAETLLKTMVDK